MLCILWGALSIALAIVVACETGLVQPGWLTGNVMVEYVVAMVLELLTLIVIPLSLWLFKWKKVTADLKQRNAKALATWGTVRLFLLCIPMLAAIIAYYLFKEIINKTLKTWHTPFSGSRNLFYDMFCSSVIIYKNNTLFIECKRKLMVFC